MPSDLLDVGHVLETVDQCFVVRVLLLLARQWHAELLRGLRLRISRCRRICVCVYACMRVCVYVCMCESVCVFVCACMCACVSLCVCVCACVSLCVCVCARALAHKRASFHFLLDSGRASCAKDSPETAHERVCVCITS